MKDDARPATEPRGRPDKTAGLPATTLEPPARPLARGGAGVGLVAPRRASTLAEEVSEELLEIKREIVESRGLVIKTNNLTNALAADLKGINKRQAAFERRAFWNSAGANALFVLVTIAVVALAWDARMDSVDAKTKGVTEKIAALEEEKKQARAKADERTAAESAAAAFYEVVRSEKQKEIIEGFEALRKMPLSRAELAFFQDAVDKAKSELSVKAYQAGLDHMRTARWHEAALAFEEALSRKSSGAHIPSAKLNLARAYKKLNRQKDAIPILMPLSEASPDPEIMDDATFLLAECFIDIQAYNDAKSTLRAFIRRFPDSPLLNDARMALADLSIKH
jgi:TolA-binding protein